MNAHHLIRDLQSRGIVLKLEGESLTLKPKSALTPDLVETIKAHKAQLIAVLSVPRLPWQLEHLVQAACNGALVLNLRGIPDTTRYVMAWACSYLTSDKEESLRRLWEVYQSWQSAKN